jgi:DnaJ-class molecular chaperone
MKYPYDILGITEDAANTEIRSAYLKKIQYYTPEKFPKQFQDIVEAYGSVKDVLSRAKLSVFGILPKDADLRIKDIITRQTDRKRIGINNWLELMKD